MMLLISLVGFVAMATYAEAQSKTVDVSYAVPKGIYVHRDRPPCGGDMNLQRIANNASSAGQLAALLGVPAEPVVLVTSGVLTLAQQQGGSIAKWLKDAAGLKNVAACQTQCVPLPAGSQIEGITFTKRDGAAHCTSVPKKNHPRFGFVDVNCNDYSEWRQVVTMSVQGRPIVCATAANWDSERASNAKMTITYR